MKLIVLTGWSESGKDTVADILVKKYYFKKYAIASPLKDLCSRLYGFPRELADTQEGKKTIWQVGHKSKSIRDLLLETALLDKSRFGESIYIDEVLQQISNENPQNAVITDLRYFPELDAIKTYVEQNGDFLEVWKIIRQNQTESPVKDVSEYALITLNPHAILVNDGISLETLEQTVSEAITRKKDELSTPQNEDDGCSIV